MKKQLSQFALGLAFFSGLTGFSQEQTIQPCETFAAMEDHFARNPAAKATYEALEQNLKQKISENYANGAKAAAFEYTIPVVFHILHTGGPENISDATCISALDWVNKDLARLHSDTATIASIYKNLYVNSEIKLMLAKKDKNGNCTNGIVHRYDTRTIWDRSGNLNLLYAGITAQFPTSQYLNIIIVKEIVSQAGGLPGSIVVGYTYKPNSWGTNAAQDAIVYRYDYLTGSRPRSLTHELGHWLNLDHTFGPTNNPGTSCGDDGLSDTPPTKGNFSQCPSSLSGNTCAGSGGKTNVENIMDYSNCPKNFTIDQTNYMRSTLANIGKRQSLWSPVNIANSDVNGTGFCRPIAEFLSSTDTYTLCAGGSVTMRDLTYNGPVDTYLWDADNNAIVSSPNTSVTSILFPNIGITNVTLTVSNAQGSTSTTKVFHVLDNTPGITGPHMESFEAMGTPQGWLVINPDAGSSGWERTDWSGYDGLASFYLNTSANPADQIDYLQTPIIDMQNSPNQKFEFMYAYAKQTAGHSDKFKIQASTDCAASWIDMLELSANQMYPNSGGVQSAPFYPAVAEEWKKIDLSTYPGASGKWAGIKTSPNVIIRFVFTQGSLANGNNIFIDAVNIPAAVTITTGIAEFRKDLQFNLYPNPTSDGATVSFRLNDPASVEIGVVDILGREVSAVPAARLEAGEHDIILGDQLPAGVYNVNLKVNGTKVTNKLIVQ